MATGDKKVVLMVPESKMAIWEDIINRFIDHGIMKDSVRVVQLVANGSNPGSDDIQSLQSVVKTSPSVTEFQADDGSFTHKFTAVVGPGKKGMTKSNNALLCRQRSKLAQIRKREMY